MKGILISHEDGGSYVLDRHGACHFVKGHTETPLGTEVSFGAPVRFPVKRILSAVACILIVLLGAGGYYFGSQTAYIIDIDINPSIEVAVNNLNRVKSVHGLNQDGELLIAAVDKTRGAPLDVVASLLKEARTQGYIPPEDNGTVAVLLTVTAVRDVDTAAIMEAIDHRLSDSGLGPAVSITGCEMDQWSAAREHGLSPSRMKLMETLQALDTDISWDDLAHLPIAEITGCIEERGEQLRREEAEAQAAAEAARQAEKQAEKEAKEAQRPVEKEAKEEEKTADEAEKQAEKEAEEAEKQAEKEAKQAQKDAAEAQRQAEKEAKEAEKQAEAEAREAEKQAENDAKQAEKDDAEAQRQAEKEAREAEKQAEDETRQAEKDEAEAQRQAEKEAREAERQAEDEARQAEKEAAEAQRQAEKEVKEAEKQAEKEAKEKEQQP